MKTTHLLTLFFFLFSACLPDSNTETTELTQRRINHLERQISFLEKRISELERSGTTTAPSKKQQATSSASVIKRNVTFELDDGYYDDPYFGSDEPSKIMVVYTDLNCKTCKDFLKNTLPSLKEKFSSSKELQIRLRDFPLSRSSVSQPLAMAAHCAGEKGAYWDFLNKTLELDIKTEKDIFTTAKSIPKLNFEEFTSCMNSSKYVREIELDKEHGKSIGISGSPGILVAKRMHNRLYSGTIIRGNQPEGLILEELEFLR